ncbi:hypothetical protein [Streptomyces sp. NPDC087270]|uniref:hypothetical protein n=1 Tax=Streptomyces sp. NPDC087270 TaxID=3365774 RepID=UPI00382AF3A3
MTSPPPKCLRCQINRIAWSKPRVEVCYQCLPGGPFTPPPCAGCGSTDDDFSQGLCSSCHPGGPTHPGSCRGCLAWGVQRSNSWNCWSCRWWAQHYPAAACMVCGQTTPIGEGGACRLCSVEGRRLKEPGRAVDYAAVSRSGQQLYLANLHHAYAPRRQRDALKGTPVPAQHDPQPGRGGEFTLARHRQLLLFRMPPHQGALKRRIAGPDTEMLVYGDGILREHAARHGWSKKVINEVKRSLKLTLTGVA